MSWFSPANLIRSLLAMMCLIANPAFANETTLRTYGRYSAASADPVYVTTDGETQLASQLFEGLYTIDATGKTVLGQAETAEVSADGLVHTFRLRSDAFWSNGDPVVAQDFELTFKRLLDPAIKAFPTGAYLLNYLAPAAEKGAAFNLSDVIKVRALDDRTLEIRLAAPSPFLAGLLKAPPMSPTPSRVYATKGENWALAPDLVSNGAYTLERLEVKGKNRLYILRKNARYRDAANVFFGRIEQLTGEMERDAAAMLADAELDMLFHYNGQRLAWLTQTNGAVVTHSRQVYTTYLAFNLAEQTTRDVRVRRALALATNVIDLAARLDPSTFSPASSFAPRNDLLGWQPAARPYASMPMNERYAQARALLEAAGYNGEKPLTLQLLLDGAGGVHRLGAALAEQWTPLGIKLEMRQMPGRELYAALGRREYQASRASWTQDIDNPADYLALLRSGHIKNYAGWTDARYDEMADSLRRTIDATERTELFSKMEALIAEEVPILPLYHGTYSVVSRAGLTGIRHDPSLSVPLRFIRPIVK